MPTYLTIEKYQLLYFAKRDSESKEIARITLFNAKNRVIGNIKFYKDGQPVPNNSEYRERTSSRVNLYVSENQLPRIVDMLRNEKPCSVSYVSPTWAYVHTGLEPVGEEETE